jgi:hypothetical protein
MQDLQQIRARIAGESAEFILYRASEQTKQLAALYDALIDGLLHELATVSADQLAFKQGALAQLTALRRALAPNAQHINLTV